MLNSSKILFPYYSGNIYKTNVLGHISIADFVRVHNNPKQNTIDVINKVQEAKKNNDLKLKRKLKHQLYSFTPSVYIPLNERRCYDKVQYYTGLMQLDFDGIEDVQTAVDLKGWLFEQQEVVCSYISPSGLGVKGLINVKQPESKEHFKAIHTAVCSKYEEVGYLDLATKNAMLPLFLSIDKQILSRDFSECQPWVDEDWTTPKYVRLNETQPTNFKSTQEDARKTIRILTDKISNIVDNGHPQVRSAALILGSRAGAGYLTIIEARQEIEFLIKNNNYLNKGISGYLSTALWGISEGYKNPKYYD